MTSKPRLTEKVFRGLEQIAAPLSNQSLTGDMKRAMDWIGEMSIYRARRSRTGRPRGGRKPR